MVLHGSLRLGQMGTLVARVTVKIVFEYVLNSVIDASKDRVMVQEGWPLCH